jgi:hypothetical protein
LKSKTQTTLAENLTICSANPLKAVLEAKREAVGFNLPTTSNPNAAQKIEPIVKSCKNFRQAFEQVVPYCAMKGSPIAIVCNGPQLVIFF